MMVRVDADRIGSNVSMIPATRLVEDLSQAQIEEIERRMRDPRFSRAGFLGPEETLREVIESDALSLRALGVTHERIAHRLVEICTEGLRAAEARPAAATSLHPRGRWARLIQNLLLWPDAERHEGTLGPVRPRSWLDKEVRRRKAAYQALRHEPWPGCAVELDGFRLILEGARPRLLPSGFGFAHLSYFGYQYCPFRDPASEPCGLTDCDFLIANPRRGEWIVFSGLLPHLIAAHHFSEGRGTAYRLDPEMAVRVLELGASVSESGDAVAPAGSISPHAG
jgi:hypothetical protein